MGSEPDASGVTGGEGNRADGTDRGKSERLVVPKKPGNLTQGLGGGKGARDHGTAGGNDGRHREVGDRLNETSADS